MLDLKAMRPLALFAVLTTMCSCHRDFGKNDYRAYFGGEVVNPNNRFVLFCKDDKVIDTIPLEANNTFFKAFDSLAPGLYSFRHEPEYQYVYFDKNDSLMVHVNSRNFDESVVFCGRGDQKNNFLMEQYLRDEKDKDNIFNVLDYDVEAFIEHIDSVHEKNEEYYKKRKSAIKWSPEFDKVARAAVDLHYYSKKEIYPSIHKMRTGDDVIEKLPADFYDYRARVNVNDSVLASFAPYVSYLTNMINNMSAINYHNHFSADDLTLKTNLGKLEVADSLIKNEKLKNTVLNNIAFGYLLEDQRMENNQKFLDMFHKYSTDDIRKNEITRIGNSIQLLKSGNHLSSADLVDVDGNKVSSESFEGKTTVVFCWTEKLSSHFFAAHKKAADLAKKYPNIQFIAINVDGNRQKWKNELAKLQNHNIKEFQAKDFKDLRNRWAITKIHRTIVLNADGRIKNAFTNLFDADFEKELQTDSFRNAVTVK